MDTLWHDLKYALRTLRSNPGFAAVAVLTLALGIGANTAIFSVLDGILLRALPYDHPAQLVKVWGKFEKIGLPRNWISEPEWWDLRDSTRSFSDLAAFSTESGANLVSGAGEPVRVVVRGTWSSLFPLLGVRPALGRTFTPEEDLPGHNVIVLSDGAWRTLFGSSRSVIGANARIDARSYTVVGVLPPGFDFTGRVDVWMPLGIDRAHPDDRDSHSLEVLARLKSGVTFAQASGEVSALAARLDRQYPDDYRGEGGLGMFISPLQEELVGNARPALLVLAGAVGLVLLIACGNVANLLLARASARKKEVAIRAALGASRARLVRQLLTESVVLALFGGGLGLLLAVWAVDAIRAFFADVLPRVGEVRLNIVVLGFTLIISVLTGVIFGLAPALQSSGRDAHDSLKEAMRGASTSAERRRTRNILVVGEVALSLVLLVGAGLLLRSFDRLLQVSPGFHTDHLLTMQLSLPEAKYKSGPPVNDFFKLLLEKVRTLPGVKAAGAVRNLPLSGSYQSGGVKVEETSVTDVPRLPGSNIAFLETDKRPVTPGYFEAMQIPLLQGRLFTDADDAQAPPVAIVDADFAKRFWPGTDPLGKHITVESKEWRTVVGVVGHVKHYALDVKGREQAYVPQEQNLYARSMFLVVRTAGDPAAETNAIRRLVTGMDAELPLYSMTTMEDLLGASVAQPRLNLILLGLFAALAMALAAVGIYGVLAYSVTLRTREIGIRLALGAAPRDALGMVFRQALVMALIGIGLGLAGALALTHFISALLFSVTPTDPVTYTAVSTLLLMVALAASYIPARRATRVDPMVALRYE